MHIGAWAADEQDALARLDVGVNLGRQNITDEWIP
jgi:hypothetical protein